MKCQNATVTKTNKCTEMYVHFISNLDVTIFKDDQTEKQMEEKKSLDSNWNMKKSRSEKCVCIERCNMNDKIGLACLNIPHFHVFHFTIY
jgi:hypothetical protein